EIRPDHPGCQAASLAPARRFDPGDLELAPVEHQAIEAPGRPDLEASAVADVVGMQILPAGVAAGTQRDPRNQPRDASATDPAARGISVEAGRAIRRTQD